MELLLFDLCHNVFSFLSKETASCEETQTHDDLTTLQKSKLHTCTKDENKDVCVRGGRI